MVAAVDLEQLAVGAAGDGEGGRVAGIGVGRGEREDVSCVLVDREVPLEVKAGGSSLRVLDGDRHGDRVGVGPVGDLDHDGAGVGVVTGAAALGSRSRAPRRRRARRRRSTLNGSWSTLAAFWAAVRIEVGLGGGAVGVGGREGAGGGGALVGRGGCRSRRR